MFATRVTFGAVAGLALLLGWANFELNGQETKPTKVVWTDAKDPSLPADFKYQGEYVGEIKGEKFGCQVIALGKGQFQAVVFRDGLPGAGWERKERTVMAGKLADGKVILKTAEGKREYLAKNPDQFSATDPFPPHGQINSSGEIADGVLTCSANGNEIKLKKTERTSPTLGKKAPEGALVLFDGTTTDEWNGGRLDKKTGFLNTDGHDITSKKKFNDYSAHLEFMLPYRPDGRGQGRGNSGFYMVHRYEIQILDSFGLEGKSNECGGFYNVVKPKLNMCLPPLVWQTYDVDFTNAVREGDKVVKKARATVKLNGVVIHDDAEIKGATDNLGEVEGTPGAIILQGHGNPLQFRNIWIVEKK